MGLNLNSNSNQGFNSLIDDGMAVCLANTHKLIHVLPWCLCGVTAAHKPSIKETATANKATIKKYSTVKWMR